MMEIMLPEYFRPDKLKFKGDYRIIGREKVGGVRHYVVQNGDEILPIFYPGVTSIIENQIPKEQSLIKWQASFPGGYDACVEYVQEKADYGTTMHSLFVDYINESVPDVDSAEYDDYIRLLISRTGRDEDKYLGMWRYSLTKNLFSFVQWMSDYEVEIWAMEVPLVSKKYKFAGQVDCFGMINAQKYTEKTPPEKRKRIRMITDFKSGGIYETYAIQLGLYDVLMRENYGIRKIDAYFNWSPNDWKKSPGYSFINQTDKVDRKRIMHMLKGYMMDRRELPKRRVLRGMPKPGEDMNQYIDYLTPEEYYWEEISKRKDY